MHVKKCNWIYLIEKVLSLFVVGFLSILGVTIFALNVKQGFGYSLHLCAGSGASPFLLMALYAYGGYKRLESTVMNDYRAEFRHGNKIIHATNRRVKLAMKREGLFQT